MNLSNDDKYVAKFRFGFVSVHEADRDDDDGGSREEQQSVAAEEEENDGRGNHGKAAHDRFGRRSQPQVHEAGEDRAGVRNNSWHVR